MWCRADTRGLLGKLGELARICTRVESFTLNNVTTTLLHKRELWSVMVQVMQTVKSCSTLMQSLILIRSFALMKLLPYSVNNNTSCIQFKLRALWCCHTPFHGLSRDDTSLLWSGLVFDLMLNQFENFYTSPVGHVMKHVRHPCMCCSLLYLIIF